MFCCCFVFHLSFYFCSHCWSIRGKEKSRSRRSVNSYLLALVICPGTRNIFSSCAWRQGSKGHALSRAQMQALQERQCSWDLASRVGRKPLQDRLSSSRDCLGLPDKTLWPFRMGDPPQLQSFLCTLIANQGMLLDSTGLILSMALGPVAHWWWTTSACVVVCDHSNHCSETSRQGRLQFITTVPSLHVCHRMAGVGR